jgi:phosphoserine phosphatase
VNRLLQVEPDRDDYFLYAYGDSRGDREMIAFADRGEWL